MICRMARSSKPAPRSRSWSSGRDLGRVLGELDHVVDHDPLCFGDRCLGVIFAQRLDEGIVQGDPTQKLCV